MTSLKNTSLIGDRDLVPIYTEWHNMYEHSAFRYRLQTVKNIIL